MATLFLTNYTEETFLDRIKENLRTCEEFSFSVSFIKKAGLVLLVKDIEAALERGVKGRLVTSTYQNFTDIESLSKFLFFQNNYPNFSCHLDFESFVDKNDYKTLGFHSKGYLFKFFDSCELIVGSSNITRYALLKNIEWDLVVNEALDSEVFEQVSKEFEHKFSETLPIDEALLKRYATRLNYSIERWDMDYDIEQAPVKPNYMQRKALKELNRYRAMGEERALVVAAAGSGKTFLAAFDALNFDPGKLLYIVHESSILKKSLETFQIVFPNKSFGIYSGESKELEADFLFSTNFSMCNAIKDPLIDLDPKEFDYIIIDECHHAVADTYKRIIEFFHPEFLLGLTATPERMDNQDIIGLFESNVPFELRLRDAIINDLVVPFHYYGIKDSLIDYDLTKKEERQLYSMMATEEHCLFVKDQIEKHRKPNEKLKCIAFCCSIAHARHMASVMAEYYTTAFLSGKNNVGERIRAFDDLQNENSKLEILFSVGILNEGVDIPGINMVLFLRPTESSTIFIQQLGRGLRKFQNKTYVTILDFIGNSYQRSVQIAFALGSLAKNFILEKRLMMKLVKDNFQALGLYEYGVQINIDEESQSEIIGHLERENFNRLSYLKKDYQNFKEYINSEFYPKHTDYLNNDCAPDLLRFLSVKIGNKKNYSYYNFLRGIDEKNLPCFSDEEITLINEVSNYLPLVRKHEYLILQNVLAGVEGREEIIADEEFDHALKYFSENVLTVTEKEIKFAISVNEPLKEYLTDLLEYGLTQYLINFGEESGFKLWHSYRMGQVQLKTLHNPKDNFKGTYFYEDTILIFASLKKDADTKERLQYKDKFLDAETFQWECEANPSGNVLSALRNKNAKALLFIRKVSDENGITLPFTYVGTGRLENERSSGNDHGTFLYDIHIPDALPDYLQYDFGL